MEWFDFFVQMIGYVGLVFSLLAFQCRIHKNVMILKTANELFFAVQYCLMGAFTGMAMNLIGSTRNMVFAYLVRRRKSTVPAQIIFSVIFVIFGILTWSNMLSLMVIAAKVVTTIAYGLKRTDILRLLTLPTSVCWLIYNASCASSAGILCEAFTIISIVSAIIRIDIVGRRKIREEMAAADSAAVVETAAPVDAKE